MKCSKCNKDAIIFQKYSGMHLCPEHFTKDFEGRAKKAIRQHRWISSGDKIAVAMSGGKDSSAVLYFLKKVFGQRPDIEIFAITIDEGIKGYRDPQAVEKIAGRYDVKCYITSFYEHFGLTLDEIVEKKGDRKSCSYCGVLRRQILNGFARELGATKIAMGFNLDDEAQSVMMNVLRGDLERLLRRQKPAEGMIPRIRPFIYLPEREVALYANLYVEGFEERGCPYSHNALRADVREMINDYNYRHPSTKYALVNLGEELKEGLEEDSTQLRTCEVCGEPVFGECGTCRILHEITGIKRN
ncbi:TIGR00269 family protein [Methanomicrobium antiquum]|uniref:TIGR00269 family protein n=1 Tax=Methanomicrobium antiquum TaxID=487686 RepID=A0AAF0FVU0_9EURY|nr:TIGR00269 family protein [Methanomicrobium antiquum]MDD3977106.1 TIGR00269 family protein [Methanomicrobium sp.]WFN36845.1 TIGR00269 family protein [Methanomicrobium antiquum]